MLKLRAIEQYYGESHTLWNLNLDIPEGACMCLMGRNGVGKTTLLKAIMGLIPVRSGEILFQGQNLPELKAEQRARAGIGYVPQGREIFPLLSVEENLKTRQEAAKQAEEIIDIQVAHFLSWLRVQGASDTIRDYRQQAEIIRDEVLQKTLAGLKQGQTPEQCLELLAHRLTNKLIHAPSIQIRQASMTERHDLVAAARELFQLQDSSIQ